MGALTYTLFAAILIASAMGSTSSEPAQPGGFVSFCAFTGANLTNNHWLGVYCENNQIQEFGYNYSWIDLNFCVGNRGGQLIGLNHGLYTRTCTRCTIAHDTTLMLICVCQGIRNRPFISTLDLNTTIYDLDGSTGCFEHLGNKTWEGP